MFQLCWGNNNWRQVLLHSRNLNFSNRHSTRLHRHIHLGSIRQTARLCLIDRLSSYVSKYTMIASSYLRHWVDKRRKVHLLVEYNKYCKARLIQLDKYISHSQMIGSNPSDPLISYIPSESYICYDFRLKPILHWPWHWPPSAHDSVVFWASPIKTCQWCLQGLNRLKMTTSTASSY